LLWQPQLCAAAGSVVAITVARASAAAPARIFALIINHRVVCEMLFASVIHQMVDE
jgi:hypothetical protein